MLALGIASMRCGASVPHRMDAMPTWHITQISCNLDSTTFWSIASMSSGAFTITKYAASYGNEDQIHPIRVQPETLTATIGGTANAAPAGAVNNPIQCRVSGGKRAIGLLARYVTIKLPAENQPAGYQAGGTTRIPALTPAFYALAVRGTNITYLGVVCKVVSRSRERVDGSDGG